MSEARDAIASTGGSTFIMRGDTVGDIPRPPMAGGMLMAIGGGARTPCNNDRRRVGSMRAVSTHPACIVHFGCKREGERA